MGFHRDQEGIMNRYLREKGNWDSHLNHSKEFIIQCFRDERIQTVAVLGSGWLLDVPLDKMTERFSTIYLVDIRHPPQVRKRVESMKRVKLVETDLTGGAIEQLWKRIHRQRLRDPEEIIRDLAFTPPLEQLQPDAHISVNLLNQLDILLCDYLEKRRHFQQQPLIRLRSWLQKTHLDWIMSRPGCVITDTVEVNRDKSGIESRKNLIYCDLPEGIHSSAWMWEFDSRGTYHSGNQTRMEVRAVEWS
jgi:hypothetical protein